MASILKPKVPGTGVPVHPSLQRQGAAATFNRGGAAAAKTGGTTTSVKNKYTSTQSTGNRALTEKLIDPNRSVQSGAAAGLSPTAAAQQAAGAQGAQGGAPAPFVFTPDAAYNAAVARLQFNSATGIADIDREQSQADSALATARSRLQEDRPKVDQQAREGMNRQGLFWSGQLGKALGEIAQDFTRRESDLQTEYGNASAARAAAREAILRQQQMEADIAYAEARDRQIGRDSEAAAQGALAGPQMPLVAPGGIGGAIPGGQRMVKTPAGNMAAVGTVKTVNGKRYKLSSSGEWYPA